MSARVALPTHGLWWKIRSSQWEEPNLQADLYTVHLNNMSLSFIPSKTADTRPDPTALTTEELEQARVGTLLSETAFGPYE